jgi:hypothetical protein
MPPRKVPPTTIPVQQLLTSKVITIEGDVDSDKKIAAFKKVNGDAWERNSTEMKKKLVSIDMKAADKKLQAVSEEIDKYASRVNNFAYLTSPKQLFSPIPAYKEINEKTWEANIGLKKKLEVLEMSVAAKKIEVIDEEIGDAIINGTIVLPDHAKSTPVVKLMKEEKERVSVATSSDNNLKPDWQFKHEYRLNLCAALRQGQIDCVGCLTGIGCEWDGPMGELLRVKAKFIKNKKPNIEQKQIRYYLYRSYVMQRFGKELAEKKSMGDKDPRIPLPLCVEVAIKQHYSGGKTAKESFIWFKKNRQE